MARRHVRSRARFEATLLAIAVATVVAIAAATAPFAALIEPAFAQSPHTRLYLDPLPTRAVEGEAISIYGWLEDLDGYVIMDATILIKDDVRFGRDDTLGSLTTNEDGEFYGTWTAPLRPGGGAYDIYAVFEGAPGLLSSRSATHSVTVAAGEQATSQPQSAPSTTSLYLYQLPSRANEGEAISIYGWLAYGDNRAVSGATIYVKDDVDFGPDDTLYVLTTANDGTFRATWTAPLRPGGGAYDIYAMFEGAPGFQSSRSATHSVTVVSTAVPTWLTLYEPQERVYAGSTIWFTGRLVSADGPVAGARIEIKEDDPALPDQLIGRGTTDANGEFAVRWTAKAGLVEKDFDIYAEFDGDRDYLKDQSSRHEVAVLKRGGDIRLDPLPRSAAEGDMVMFSGRLELDTRSPEGAKVYIMDEDALNPDDLLATAYVEADGRFEANWFASRVDADRTVDVYAVFEGDDRFYRQTTCDDGPTFSFGGLCRDTIQLGVREARPGPVPVPPPGAGSDDDGAYMEMYYTLDMPRRPHVVIAPNPHEPGDAMRYIAPVQEGIMMWTAEMERRYGGDWGVTFETAMPGDPFHDRRPDVMVNLVSHEVNQRCASEYLGWADVYRNPPHPVQTYVCTTTGKYPMPASEASTTAAHEFIHAMGLGHTFNKRGDMMCSIEEGRPTCPGSTTESNKPSALNMAAVAAMYGTDGFADPNNRVRYESRYYPTGAEDASGAGGAGREAASTPEWFKPLTGWWVSGAISDAEFVAVMEYMIREELMDVPPGENRLEVEDAEERAAIPQWVKTRAERWVDGTGTSAEFARGIMYLLSTGAIRP